MRFVMSASSFVNVSRPFKKGGMKIVACLRSNISCIVKLCQQERRHLIDVIHDATLVEYRHVINAPLVQVGHKACCTMWCYSNKALHGRVVLIGRVAVNGGADVFEWFKGTGKVFSYLTSRWKC